MGASSNPQSQGGSNVPFPQPPYGPRQMPNPPHQSIPTVPTGNLYQMSRYQSMPQPYRGSYLYPPNQYMGGAYGPFGLNSMSPFNQKSFMNTPLPFLATLKLLDLSKLTNDPILHHLAWPPVPVKIPTDILKFEGKTGDDPASHTTTYHL